MSESHTYRGGKGPRWCQVEGCAQMPGHPVHGPKPIPEAKKPIGTIDLTPSWTAVVGFYIEIIQTSADPTKRADAKKEIMRAAKLADLYVKEHKR